jgi:hypothetical protein
MLDVDSSIARTHSAVEITSSAAEVVSAEEERPGKRVKSNTLNLTVKDILSDSLTQMANQYWGPGNDKLKPFESNVVESIYSNEIHPSKGKSSTTRLLLLEFSCYLEKYISLCCCLFCRSCFSISVFTVICGRISTPSLSRTRISCPSS